MKRNQSSVTAEGIAFMRARESARPAGERVCYDPLARAFVSPVMYRLLSLFAGYGARRSPGVQEFLIARTRFIDDRLQACLDEGLEQLVILGAGFDSRAYRFEGIPGRVQTFEVDHPATQAVKLQRLVKALGALPAHVTFVGIDFTEQTLDRLLECRYDPGRRTLFIWEGVTYYLPPAPVDGTLAWIAAHAPAGSRVIFDYMDAEALSASKKRFEVTRMQRFRRFTGEAFHFGIERGGLEPLLARHGFQVLEQRDHEYFEREYYHGARPVAPIYAIAYAEVVAA